MSEKTKYCFLSIFNFVDIWIHAEQLYFVFLTDEYV